MANFRLFSKKKIATLVGKISISNNAHITLSHACLLSVLFVHAYIVFC